MAHAARARVTALVSARHLDLVRGLGADEAFGYRATDPGALGRFDVVIDPVARDMRRHRRLLTKTGRMAALNIEGLGQAAYLIGSSVFGTARVRFVRYPLNHEILTALTELVDAKAVKPEGDSVYPLDEVVGARRSLQAGGGFGKRVVQVRYLVRRLAGISVSFRSGRPLE